VASTQYLDAITLQGQRPYDPLGKLLRRKLLSLPDGEESSRRRRPVLSLEFESGEKGISGQPADGPLCRSGGLPIQPGVWVCRLLCRREEFPLLRFQFTHDCPLPLPGVIQSLQLGCPLSAPLLAIYLGFLTHRPQSSGLQLG
jgi:hypothetical protein